MDCIIQVVLDNFHIEMIEVSLGIPLTNYYDDDSLLEGEDTYSFQMFDNCTQSIFEARGDTMPPKEGIRLETALLNFSLCYYPGQMDHISCCLSVCDASLRGEDTYGAIVAAGLDTNPITRQAPMSNITGTCRPLDEAAIDKF